MAIPPNLPLDALRELISTGMGKAAAALSSMLAMPIEIEVPSVAFFQPEDLAESRDIFGDTPLACVWIGFHGPFTGTAMLTLPSRSATALVEKLTSHNPAFPNIYAAMAETLNEVGNIVINCIIGSIGNALARPFELSLPYYLEGKLEELLKPRSDASNLTILLVRASFTADDQRIAGNVFLLFELRSFETLAAAINALIPAQRP